MTTSQTIQPTTMTETISTSIEPTLHILSSTSPLTTTTITHMMETAEEEFSKMGIEPPVESKTISTSIPTLSFVSIKTENQSISPSTSTKPSRKSSNIILYSVISLLFLIICVTATALVAYLRPWYRKRRHLVGENSNTISNKPNRDTYSNINNDINPPKSSSNILSSFLSKQHNETESMRINFENMFKDGTF
jgi:hypothetical protein